jgi:hypothetical protein
MRPVAMQNKEKDSQQREGCWPVTFAPMCSYGCRESPRMSQRTMAGLNEVAIDQLKTVES